MNLKISWKRILKWVGWGLVAIVFLVFLIRVATFESWYYNDKQGSERAVATTGEGEGEVIATEEEELIEEEPTEQEVYEYTVPADQPRYLTIGALGVYGRRVLAMGVNAEGALMTPRNIFDVGWYEGSGKPGQGGTMIIDGHNGGPNVHGVFKRLPDLVAGDIITIQRGDGVDFDYKVVENVEVPLDEADAYMVTAAKSPVAGKESVTLITCSGEWSQLQGTYLSRQFVRAVLVE